MNMDFKSFGRDIIIAKAGLVLESKMKVLNQVLDIFPDGRSEVNEIKLQVHAEYMKAIDIATKPIEDESK